MTIGALANPSLVNYDLFEGGPLKAQMQYWISKPLQAKASLINPLLVNYVLFERLVNYDLFEGGASSNAIWIRRPLPAKAS